MRPLWKDEAGWFIAIAVVIALLVAGAVRDRMHHHAAPQEHGKPLILPSDVGPGWPTGG